MFTKLKSVYKKFAFDNSLKFCKEAILRTEFHFILKSKNVKITIINEIGTLPYAHIVERDKETKISISKTAYKYHMKLWKIVRTSTKNFQEKYIQFWKTYKVKLENELLEANHALLKKVARNIKQKI